MNTASTNRGNISDPVASKRTSCSACQTARTSGACYCPQCGAPLSGVDTPIALEGEFSAATTMVPEEAGQDSKATRIPVLAAANNEGATANSLNLSVNSSCPHCGRSDDSRALRLVGVGQASICVILEEEPLLIGTEDTCGLQIDTDAYVSRKHARISRDRDVCFLEDLGSSNGTLLKIQRPIMIEPGDEIIIGKTVLRLQTSVLT